MASNKDVQLIIKARDEATKSLDSISTALKQLIDAQKDLGTTSTKTDTVLSKLSKEVASLNKAAAGLTAFENAVQQLDRTGQSIARLDTVVSRSKTSLTDLLTEYGKIGAANNRLRTETEKVVRPYEQLTQAFAKQKTELKTIDQQVKIAEKSYRELGRQLRSAKGSNEGLLAQYRSERDALGQLYDAQARARQVRDQQAASLAQLTPVYRQSLQVLRDSEREQEKLRNRLVQSVKAQQQQRSSLGELRGEYARTGQVVEKASAALGGIAANQKVISEASKRTTQDIERLNRALVQQQRISRTPGQAQGSIASPQTQQILQSLKVYKEAEAETRRLAQATRSAVEPSAELQRQLTLSAAAASQAKNQYRELLQTLSRTNTSAQSTFLQFSKSATALQQASASANNLSQSVRRAENGWKGFRQRVVESSQAMFGFRTASDQAATSLARTNASANNSVGILRRLRSTVLGLTTAYFGLFGAFRQVTSVLDSFRVLEAAENRLGAVFNQDYRKVASEIDFLRSESLRLGISFEQLGDQYSRLAIAANAAGVSSEATRKLFLAVSEAARVNKLSLAETGRTFLAFEQILSKGKFTAEEVRRQLGNALPGAFNILAESLGMLPEAFDKALAEGKVRANAENISKVADGLAKRFGKQLPDSLKSLTAQIGRFQAILFDLRLQISQGGFATELQAAFTSLNDTLSGGAGIKAVDALSKGFVNLVKAAQFVVENFDKLIAVFKVFAAFKIATFVTNTATSFLAFGRSLVTSTAAAAGLNRSLATLTRATRINLITSMTTSSNALAVSFGNTALRSGVLRGSLTALSGTIVASTRLFRVFWLAVGGWPGAIIAAATTALTLLFNKTSSGADNAVTALNRQEAAVRGLQDAFSDVGKDANAFAAALNKTSTAGIQFDLQALRNRLNELRDDLNVPSQAGEALRSLVLGSRGSAPLLAELRKLEKEFQIGRISAEQYREEVQKFALKNPDFNKDLIAKLIATADAAKDVENQIKQGTALAMVKLTGTVTDAQREVLGLSESVRTLNTDFSKSGDIERYRQALIGVKELIPEMRLEAQKLSKIADLESLTDQIFKAGPPTQEALALIEQARKAIDKEFDLKSDALFKKQNKEAIAAEKARQKELEKARKEEEKKAKVAKTYMESLREQTAELGFQLQNLQETERQQQINTALRRADIEAVKAGVDTQTEAYRQQRDVLADLTGQLFDKQQEEKEQVKLEKELQKLLERRRILLEQIAFFEERGQFGAAERLRVQFEKTNVALDESINKQIAFWQAAGGPDAENAILQLESYRQDLQAVGEQSAITGRQINDLFAQGASTATLSWVDELMAGADAFDSLKDAFSAFAADFLRQMAQMILQAAILKAITGSQTGGAGGFGGRIAGFLGSLFHQGGIVGAGGGATRMVDPAVFSRAMRYHNGGVAGLRPNEVPAILERGEEVLTANDPRHAANGGGSGGQNIKIVNAINPSSFLSEALNQAEGEKVLLNYMRQNRTTIRETIGV